MTRKNWGVWLAIAVIAIGLIMLAAGCKQQVGTGPGGTQGDTFLACNTTIAQQPHWDASTGLIQAETHSTCARVPDSHVVTITLWYHPYPNHTIAHPKFTSMGNSNSGAFPGQNGYPGCGVAPHPGEPTECIVAKRGICHPGVWKITVLVTGSMEGRDFSWKMPNSDEKHQHIDHCARNPNS